MNILDGQLIAFLEKEKKLLEEHDYPFYAIELNGYVTVTDMYWLMSWPIEHVDMDDPEVVRLLDECVRTPNDKVEVLKSSPWRKVLLKDRSLIVPCEETDPYPEELERSRCPFDVTGRQVRVNFECGYMNMVYAACPKPEEFRIYLDDRVENANVLLITYYRGVPVGVVGQSTADDCWEEYRE